MSVRFIIGRSGYGKTYQCIRDIRERLLDDPQGQPIIYLVPDQMTFQSEKALSSSEDIAGIIRAQVFSFSRLAWKVLQETGGLARTHLTSVGTNMMLRKIIEHHRPQLHAFQSAADKVGFIDKTAEMMAEFKRYCVDPCTISVATESNQALQDKLHDLQLIYRKFVEQLHGQYVDTEDYLTLLAEKIPFSSYIANAEVWVDGFHSFTPNEYVVLEALMRQAEHVTFTCTMESPYEHDPSELDLFHENARNYRTLMQIASENNIAVEEPILLRTPHRFRAHALTFLEDQFEKRPAKSIHEASSLQLSVAVNRRAEVDAVAREIISLVRDKRYAYRDISVMTRDVSTYHNLIETIFTDYNIPFFLDEKRPMLHHPLIEFIRSIFDTITENWRYESMFRAIKTDFFIPIDSFEKVDVMRTEFDQLENVVLKFGLQGKRWKNDLLWEQFIKKSDKLKEKEFMKKMYALRNLVHEPLLQFEKAMKAATTGREMAEALYNFIIALEIPEKLHILLTHAESDGDLKTAQEHDQAWKAVIGFLDEIVEIVGEETLSLDLFAKLVESGMESMKFSLVPPSLDQVLIGSVDRSRYTDVKCVFLIGVNEGILPAKPVENGLLTEKDRDVLTEMGIMLAPASTRQLLDEQFYIYLSLTTAEELLYISYPLADEEGKSLFPSPVIGRIKELFPSLEEQLWTLEPQNDENDFAFITTPYKSFSILTSIVRNWRRGYPMSNVWWHTYNWFVTNDYDEELQLLQRSLFYKNYAEPLSEKTSSELYGDVIQVSVSRMERFQACPFQQFASHGLRLKERQLFSFRAPDIGQLFHDALNLIAEDLRQRNVEWSALSEKQCFQLADNFVQFLAPRMQHEILLSSNRHHYLTRKLKQVVGRAVSILAKQARRSGFSPVGVELEFGRQAPLPPVTYELDNGTKLEVVGRIDRVDQAIGDEGIYLRVIDYKSSARDLNLSEVYYGISMQMLTYLDVVITHAPTWIGQQATPAGVLYFHIHNPMLQVEQSISNDQIEEQLFKQFKMKGLVLNDREALSLMDDEITEKNSDIVPAGFRKDGKPTKNSKVATREDFDVIRSHIRHMTRTIGTKLTSGIVDISPYRLKKETPCTFCEYRSLCQFDQSLAENQFRSLKVEQAEDVLLKMLEERNVEQ